MSEPTPGYVLLSQRGQYRTASGHVTFEPREAEQYRTFAPAQRAADALNKTRLTNLYRVKFLTVEEQA